MVSSVSNGLMAALQSQGYTVKPVGPNGQGVAQSMSATGGKDIDLTEASKAKGMRDGFAMVNAGDPKSNEKLKALLSKLDDKTREQFLKDQEQADPLSTLMDALVKAFDVNGDGKFDAGDASAAGSKDAASGPTVESLTAAIKSLMKTLDVNKDGKIDQTDVDAVKNSKQPGAADQAKLLDSLIKSLDINKDGKLDQGDLDKLKSGTDADAKGAVSASALSDVLSSLLKVFDGNKDGKMDKADIDGLKKEEKATSDAATKAANAAAKQAMRQKLLDALKASSSGDGANAAPSLANLLTSRHVGAR